MERLLAIAIILASLEQFGMTYSQLAECRSRECLKRVEIHSRDILKIDWKPISVFPEDAKLFQSGRK